MDFYRNSGHSGDVDSTRHLPQTLETVLERERVEPNSSIDAERILRAVTKIAKESSVHPVHAARFLDVGCGYGFFSKAAQSVGFDVTAIELAATERAIATSMLGVEPLQCSFEDFASEPGQYSVVLMSQILEHALDSGEWISKAHTLLQPNGQLVIALPNFDSIFRRLMQEREPYICPPAHINFFSAQSLSRLLQKHGFQVEDRQWVTRIPTSALRNRLGNLLAAGVAPLAKIASTSVDFLRLGMMVNIYARKI